MNSHTMCRCSITSVLCVIAGFNLAAAERPNVLLIMTDDQGYGDLSLHGNPVLTTPHLDELGRAGVRFERFYVNSFCAPTRASLLTGRYHLRTGCFGVTQTKEAIRTDEFTLGELFQSAGYRTTCIGKWHNGEQYPYTPLGQGFDESFGFHNGHINDYFDAVLLRGHEPEQTAGYITDVLTDEALRFIERNRDQPFFCYLSYNAPHSPYQLPDKYYDKYLSKNLPVHTAAFLGMCENIDDNVGRLRQQLRDLALEENTIVLFLTDNGTTAGRDVFNAGMRGGKTSVHEGGCRVPLFVYWPRAGWQAHAKDHLASHIDLLPTLADLCGIPLPDNLLLDGISLRPVLENRADATWIERIIFTHNPITETNQFPAAVRTDRYRLVREIKGPAGGSAAVGADRTASSWQLYDMHADPGQRQDIARNHPEVVRSLSIAFEEWYAEVAKSGRRRLPLPVGHPEHNPVRLHAPQAYFDAPISFQAGPGYAHDWLTNWSGPARVWFEIDVAHGGEYELELAYSCPEADAGSTLRITAGRTSREVVIQAAPPEEVPLPHRDEMGHDKYRNRVWETMSLGYFELPVGEGRILLEPTRVPGAQLIDFKHLQLTRRSAAAPE